MCFVLFLSSTLNDTSRLDFIQQVVSSEMPRGAHCCATGGGGWGAAGTTGDSYSEVMMTTTFTADRLSLLVWGRLCFVCDHLNSRVPATPPPRFITSLPVHIV